MSFLKENAFLVITAGALLVCSAVALVWANSAGGTADGRAEMRTKLSRDMTQWARRPVNERIVNHAKEKVETLREHRETVAAEFRKRSEAYRVMQFTAKYLGGGMTADAFPIKDDLYAGRGMRKQFPARYLECMDALLASLKPTRPPTAEEIGEEIDRVKAKMGTGTPRGPVGGPYMRPEMLDVNLDPRVGRRPPGGEGATPEQREKTPEEKALASRVAAQAQAGMIYAERSGLDERLMPDSDYSDKDLYLSQVNLWVHRDIIEAIRLTNEDSGEATARGVRGSVIKRLVGVRFRGYVCNRQSGQTGGGRGMAGGRGRQPAMGAPATGGQAAVNPVYVDTVRPRAAVGGPRRGAVVGGVPLLTGRVTNQLYDVVHYEFTVVASAPDLLKLYRNLLRLNYHTILTTAVGKADRTGVPAAAPAAAGARPAGGMGNLSGVQVLYDYGTGPVVEATIVGELLIMADWTRGRWDAEAGDWDEQYPPLMPVEFLKEIQNRDASALREKDTARKGMTP